IYSPVGQTRGRAWHQAPLFISRPDLSQGRQGFDVSWIEPAESPPLFAILARIHGRGRSSLGIVEVSDRRGKAFHDHQRPEKDSRCNGSAIRAVPGNWNFGARAERPSEAGKHASPPR